MGWEVGWGGGESARRNDVTAINNKSIRNTNIEGDIPSIENGNTVQTALVMFVNVLSPFQWR